MICEFFSSFLKLSLLHQKMYREIHLLRLLSSFCFAVSTMESSAEDGNEIDF